MSDDLAAPKRDGIRYEDVVRFLDVKGTESACPSCSHNDWTLHFSRLQGEPDLIFGTHILSLGLPFSLDKQVHDNVKPVPFGRPILPLSCGFCGYYRIYDYRFIEAWVRENPKGGESNG